MKDIKKIVFLLFVFLFSFCNANTIQNSEKMYQNECPSIKEQKQIENDAKNPMPDKKCNECTIEDDEYCIYNQCYFDKQYRILKTNILPDKNQENCLDNLYNNFKQDLEILCDKYLREKNKLLEMIADDDKYLKEQKRKVKDIQQDIKEKYKDYIRDTREILNKCQKRTFRKFKRKQNKKIRQIKKYGAIYKYPCP